MNLREGCVLCEGDIPAEPDRRSQLGAGDAHLVCILPLLLELYLQSDSPMHTRRSIAVMVLLNA